jgi:replicative DNA helicase
MTQRVFPKSLTSSTQDIHRTPPHSAEAEQGVLGSMLISPHKVISEIVSKINEEYFYVPAHQTVYNELVSLWGSGVAIDLLTFTQILRDKNILESVGGASFITGLYTFVPTAANVMYYLEIVRDKYLARQIIAVSTESVRRAYEDQDEINLVLDQAQADMLKIGSSNNVEMVDIKQLVMDAIDEIEKSHKAHGSIPGLSTGLIDLDKKMGGMRNGQLIIVAGETGEGKSALGLSFVRHISVFDHKPSGIISLEMSGREITQRLIADIGKINLHNFIVTGGVASDFMRITNASAKISHAPIYIRDDSDVDAMKMRAIARQLKAEKKIEFMLVDYIQLLTPQNVKDENRERAMSTAAQALKQMAKELDIVVVGISQLNEQGKLRESRAIGHHADVVMTIEHDGLDSSIRINKNRSGPTGSVPVRFLREYTSFENAAREEIL